MGRDPGEEWSRRCGALPVLLLAVPALLAADRDAPAPRDSGLVERSEARLAQIDVAVSGPPQVLAGLTAEDFRVRIQLRRLRRFEIDRLCPLPAAAEPGAPAVAVGPAPPPPSLLLYFDQPHLTMEGRLRSLDVARELAALLLRNGAQAMVVSNARRMEIVQPFTSDPDELLGALDRLEGDRDQWHLFAHQEEGRVAAIHRALNIESDVQRAIGLARTYQREESWRSERDLRRLQAALTHFGERDLPRLVVYFADTMRANAGEHYMSFFGRRLRDTDASLGVMATDSFSTGATFDRVVNQAAAQGIRIYTVQAQGLVNAFDRELLSSAAATRTESLPPTSRQRVAHAQHTLSNLALETGAAPFLNGIATARIADRIASDASCLFLISFDPGDLPRDAPLRAVVEVDHEAVDVRGRGRVVLQSEAARLNGRLMRAFSSPGSLDDPFEVRASLVPTEFGDGTYSGLLQVHVPGTPLSATAWDVGVSVVSGEQVRAESSGRVSVAGPGIPVVFESELELRPGAYEIVTVAHETSTGLIASTRLDVVWDSPNHDAATLTPISLLQPASGAFSRDGRKRGSGSLARATTEPVRRDLPTALIGLVCRGRGQRGPLRVEREVTGVQDIPLAPIELDLRDDRCAQTRDVLPEGSLEAGFHLYRIRVLDRDRVLAEAERGFVVDE